MDPHTWPCKSRTTSTNIHSATMWAYGMLSRRPAWTIGKSGERGSGISVLPARHDDDIYIVSIFIYSSLSKFLEEFFLFISLTHLSLSISSISSFFSFHSTETDNKCRMYRTITSFFLSFFLIIFAFFFFSKYSVSSLSFRTVKAKC